MGCPLRSPTSSSVSWSSGYAGRFAGLPFLGEGPHKSRQLGAKVPSKSPAWVGPELGIRKLCLKANLVAIRSVDDLYAYGWRYWPTKPIVAVSTSLGDVPSASAYWADTEVSAELIPISASHGGHVFVEVFNGVFFLSQLLTDASRLEKQLGSRVGKTLSPRVGTTKPLARASARD